jgi:hypothetical protein
MLDASQRTSKSPKQPVWCICEAALAQGGKVVGHAALFGRFGIHFLPDIHPFRGRAYHRAIFGYMERLCKLGQVAQGA